MTAELLVPSEGKDPQKLSELEVPDPSTLPFMARRSITEQNTVYGEVKITRLTLTAESIKLEVDCRSYPGGESSFNYTYQQEGRSIAGAGKTARRLYSKLLEFKIDQTHK